MLFRKMINGFTKETEPLTDLERRLVQPFCNGLKKHVGANNAVTSKQMIVGIRKTMKVKVNDARVRKIINHIRMNGLVKNLVASSKGYYVENNIHNLKQYIISLEQRAQSIQAVADVLKRDTPTPKQKSINY